VIAFRDAPISRTARVTLRTGFVMEQTLGSVTHYLNLRANEAEAPPVEPRWLPVDYARARWPWAIEGSLRARRAMRQVAGQVDAFFLHTTTLSLLAPDLFLRKPTVISTDATPASKAAMRGHYGLAPESGPAARLKRLAYRTAFRAAAGFVAWTQWAADSLVHDYGCPPEAVAVIPPGVDTAAWAPGAAKDGLPRLLFVGGDFERKGGDLLLQVFRERLRGRATLVLVTGAQVPEEPGVEVHRGLKPNSPELRALYAGASLFVLPTRGDCLPLACLEALSSGLPLIASAVGGIPDAVRPGETGLLVPPGDARALGDALESLAGDALARGQMALRAREDARVRFDARGNARRLFQFIAERCG
jgi:glycosyltransferase involved in cell wall biosynthesis